jgi:hypothetical protein
VKIFQILGAGMCGFTANSQALDLFKFKEFPLYLGQITKLLVFLSVFFLFVGCGGENESNKDISITSATIYKISFYDENLDFVENISTHEENITLSNVKSGIWYRADEDEVLTTLDLTNDIRLYAVPNVTEITTQEQLAVIDTDNITRAGKYILINDIELNETKAGFEGTKGWKPIGSESYYDYSTNTKYDFSFTGIFNGNSHKITNLWINRPNENYVGFFGFIEGAQIRNLELK